MLNPNCIVAIPYPNPKKIAKISLLLTVKATLYLGSGLLKALPP